MTAKFASVVIFVETKSSGIICQQTDHSLSLLRNEWEHIVALRIADKRIPKGLGH